MLLNKILIKNKFLSTPFVLSILAALILYFQFTRLPNDRISLKRYFHNTHQYELFTISDLVNFSNHNHSLKHHKQNLPTANFIDSQDYEKSRLSINTNHTLFIENVLPTSLKARDRYQLFHFLDYNSPIQNAEKTELLLI